MSPNPLPPVAHVRALHKGYDRAAVIRRLYAERCNVTEIATHLRIPREEVRRVLHRPGVARPNNFLPPGARNRFPVPAA